MDRRAAAVALVAAAVAYAGSWSHRPTRGGCRRPGRFLAGIVAVAVALVSPLDGWSHRSLSGHMVQHVLLVSVAAPLLALGRPLASARAQRAARSASGRARRPGAAGRVAARRRRAGRRAARLACPAAFDAAVAPRAAPRPRARHPGADGVRLVGGARAVDGRAAAACRRGPVRRHAAGRWRYGVGLTLRHDRRYAPYRHADASPTSSSPAW